MNILMKILLLGSLALWVANCSPVATTCSSAQAIEPESGVVGTGIANNCEDDMLVQIIN